MPAKKASLAGHGGKIVISELSVVKTGSTVQDQSQNKTKVSQTPREYMLPLAICDSKCYYRGLEGWPRG